MYGRASARPRPPQAAHLWGADLQLRHTRPRKARTLVLRIRPRLLRTRAQTLRKMQMRTQPKNRHSQEPAQPHVAAPNTRAAAQNLTASEVPRYSCAFFAPFVSSALGKAAQSGSIPPSQTTSLQNIPPSALSSVDSHSLLSLVESALTQIAPVNPLESALTEKLGPCFTLQASIGENCSLFYGRPT